IVLSAPRIRLAGVRGSTVTKLTVLAMRYSGFGSAYVPGGSDVMAATGPYIGNPATSDPVRHARTKAVLETAPQLGIGSPMVSWLNAAYRAMAGVTEPSFAGKVRQ